MSFFEIDNLQRLPSTEILGTFTICVLTESTVNISCDTRVERYIGAENDVDLPVHSSAPAIRTDSLVSLRLDLRFLTAIAKTLGWPIIVNSFFHRVTAV